MPFKSKSELEESQEVIFRKIPKRAGSQPQGLSIPLNIKGPKRFKAFQAPTAAFFKREEIVRFLEELNEDVNFIKVFLVRGEGNQLTMAISGAKNREDNEANFRPTEGIFPRFDPEVERDPATERDINSSDGDVQRQGLLAFRPCPPHCQDSRDEHADRIFVGSIDPPASS